MNILITEQQIETLIKKVPSYLENLNFKKRGHYFELCNNDIVIAECGYNLTKDKFFNNEPCVSLWHLVVKKPYQGQGIGFMFLRKILNNLENHVNIVTLEVLSNNVNSIELYKKIGFEEYDRHNTIVSMFKKFTKDDIDNITEQFDYYTDPYYTENDIYDYEPSQDEIDRFIKQKYQLKNNPHFSLKEKKHRKVIMAHVMENMGKDNWVERYSSNNVSFAKHWIKKYALMPKYFKITYDYE